MLDAFYFDGKSSQRQPVTLAFFAHSLAVKRNADDVIRVEPLSSVEIGEHLHQGVRILRFSDGAFLEVRDERIDALLQAHGHCIGFVERLQRSWRGVAAAILLLLVLGNFLYFYGVPTAADHVARNLPASVGETMGDEQWAFIDSKFFLPSTLPGARQQALSVAFAELVSATGTQTRYRIEFRASKIGPNAFALPNGVIVMTDELVALAADDDAILAVLAHELGHITGRHTLRMLTQSVAVGLLVDLYLGDVTSVLTVPAAALTNMKYQRDFEREADAFAIALMRSNDKRLTPMADLFERIADEAHGGKRAAAKDGSGDASSESARERDEAAGAIWNYLSTHPSNAERTRTLKEADLRPAAAFGSN